MLEVLVFIAMFVVLGQMWQRLGLLERRLAVAELRREDMPDTAAFPGLAASSQAGAPDERRAHFEPKPAAEWRSSEPVSVDIAAARPAPAPEPLEPESVSAPSRLSSVNFEDLFGRRLAIWAGGISLAVAGVLVARYAIEAGLLSPYVRVLAGGVFGAVLIGAAEVALRLETRVGDARIHQALAGAGIATLYASILVAANLYALIAPTPAFLAMALVTALAMALSLRFGTPSAVLGLAGGLAAPALVGADQPDVPLLTLYLGLVVGGLSAVSRVQRRAWLGVTALVGGFGWGAMLVVAGIVDTAATLSVGVYLMVIGIALPVLALPNAGKDRLMRMAASVLAAAQMAVLLAAGGFSLLHWGLFGSISVATVWLARREDALRRLPPIGLALALLLAGIWPYPAPAELALVLIAAAAIYGGPALHGLWRPGGGFVEMIQIAAIAAGSTFVAAMHFYRADHSADLALAGIALAAAGLPGAAAALGWRITRRREEGSFAALVATSALLVCTAAAFAVPLAFLPFAIAAVAVGLLLFGHVAEDARIEPAAWLLLATALPLLAAGPHAGFEFRRLMGLEGSTDAGLACVRWAALAVAAAVFAWRARWREARTAAQILSALLAYGAMAQLVSGDVLPLIPPVLLLAFALASRSFATSALLPALATMLGLILGWATAPLAHWAAPALASLAGEPVLVTDLPTVRDAMLRLLAPAFIIASAIVAARRRVPSQGRTLSIALAVMLGSVAAHVLFRQGFAIGSIADFVNLGLAERTLWEALLAASGLLAWRLRAPVTAAVFAGTAFAHLGWYSLIVHNPLWAVQAVGEVPILNLLSVSYGLAFALLAFAPRLEADWTANWGRARAAGQMLLIVAFSLSTLRQLVHGSVLTVPGLPQGEDIARSILAVALAIGFLLRGIRTGSRDWRLGSLVLMLVAAAKVFLLDASGLEGLMRIASFVALGLSLIGIGWLYARALPLTARR